MRARIELHIRLEATHIVAATDRSSSNWWTYQSIGSLLLEREIPWCDCGGGTAVGLFADQVLLSGLYIFVNKCDAYYALAVLWWISPTAAVPYSYQFDVGEYFDCCTALLVCVVFVWRSSSRNSFVSVFLLIIAEGKARPPVLRPIYNRDVLLGLLVHYSLLTQALLLLGLYWFLKPQRSGVW